jgi:hypothetical protein
VSVGGIGSKGVRVFHVDGDRFVSPLKKVAAVLMPDVPSLGKGLLQPAHAIHEIGLGGVEEEVVVIAHEDEGMDMPACLVAGLTRGSRKRV